MLKKIASLLSFPAPYAAALYFASCSSPVLIDPQKLDQENLQAILEDICLESRVKDNSFYCDNRQCHDSKEPFKGPFDDPYLTGKKICSRQSGSEIFVDFDQVFSAYPSTKLGRPYVVFTTFQGSQPLQVKSPEQGQALLELYNRLIED